MQRCRIAIRRKIIRMMRAARPALKSTSLYATQTSQEGVRITSRTPSWLFCQTFHHQATTVSNLRRAAIELLAGWRAVCIIDCLGSPGQSRECSTAHQRAQFLSKKRNLRYQEYSYEAEHKLVRWTSVARPVPPSASRRRLFRISSRFVRHPVTAGPA